MDGTCYGLSAGDIKVSVVVGPCAGMGNGQAQTGYEAPRSLLVMEIINKTAGQYSGCSEMFIS